MLMQAEVGEPLRERDPRMRLSTKGALLLLSFIRSAKYLVPRFREYLHVASTVPVAADIHFTQRQCLALTEPGE